MSARAVWRRNPEDPRNALGRALPEEDRVLRKVRADLGFFGFVGAIGLFVAGHSIEAVALFLTPGLLKLLARGPRSVESILTLPLAAPTFPCTIDVKREGATIGTDRGVVTFIDGWLHFEGFRTTFSLSRADVRRRDRNALTFEGDGGIEFHPDETFAPTPNASHLHRAKAFAAELDRWYRIDPSARGHSVLPPLTLHPSGVARAWSDLLYALLKGCFLLGAIFYAVESLFHGAGFYFFIFVSGFTGGLTEAIGRFRRLRRFAREVRRPLPNDPNPSLGR